MKKLFFIHFLLFFISGTNSQQLSQVTFSNGANLSYFSFLTDHNVLMRITLDGKLIEWGIEERALRSSEYFNPKLLPYLGRVEYYDKESDSAFWGKVKTIGTCMFTYYGNYERDYKVGKLRTIGTIILDYYSEYEDKILKGKLRFIGSNILEYYSQFEDVAFRGKLRSIGNTVIKYHSSFDDKQIRGKVKSIGPAEIKWYTSLDYQRGGLNGSYRRNIGGVTYILW